MCVYDYGYLGEGKMDGVYIVKTRRDREKEAKRHRSSRRVEREFSLWAEQGHRCSSASQGLVCLSGQP